MCYYIYMIKENGLLQFVHDEDLELLEKEPSKFWEGVTVIDSQAFAGCTNLKYLVIPEGVSDVRTHAFGSSQTLKVVTLPNTISRLRNEVFLNCSNLEKIEIPSSVKKIGEWCFYQCGHLKEVILSEGLIIIDDRAFECSGIETLTVPSTVTGIGAGAFSGCIDLKSINLPDGLELLLYGAFEYCSSLEEIKIPKNIKQINCETFFHCSALKSVLLPENLESIGNLAFMGCSSLVNIDIPDSVYEIQESAFECCESLSSIKLPENLPKLSNRLFNGCKGLKSITLPKKIPSIPSKCFYECYSLKQLEIPNCVVIIENSAFFNCRGLETIYLPSSLTELGESVFSGCKSLKSITIPDGVTIIKQYTFNNCENLETIVFPKDLKEIEKEAFSGCESLTTITLPQTLQKIGYGAFDKCSNLQKLTCPIKTRVGSELFDNYRLKYIYFAKDGSSFTLSAQPCPELEKTCFCEEIEKLGTENCASVNFRNNYVKLNNMRQQKLTPFVPPTYLMKIFPSAYIEDFFINKNNHRYGRLVKQAGFDALPAFEKYNGLSELLKLCYVLGGFSKNQGKSERAFDYVSNYVLKVSSENYDNVNAGQEIHKRFSRIELDGEYCKEFAEFFMKYYKDNPDFMFFKLPPFFDERDYLCAAHNNFKEILLHYPNKKVNTNEKNALLTPELVAKHSACVQFENVDKGNEALAEIIALYGYSQENFDLCQKSFNIAKEVKPILKIAQGNQNEHILYRLLDKADPIGFVIGDITNCCQHIGGASESCVLDGFENPEAGFLVFEDASKIASEEPFSKIVGQAYVWYDPETKTVCYDNIEVPSKIKEQLKKSSTITEQNFISAIKSSADAIMEEMNKTEFKVERVTAGEGYNVFANSLSKNFAFEKYPKSKHRNYNGYTDAKNGQFVIKSIENNNSEEIARGNELFR